MSGSLAILLIAILFGVPLIAQTQRTQPREVRRNGAQRIADVVRPNEESLIVVESLDPPLAVEPEVGVSLLSWAYRLADMIFVIEVTAQRSFLTPNGDWIRSVFTASVLETVKSSNGRKVELGEVFAFTDEGGSIQVGGTQVTGRVPYRRPIEVRRRYLTFVSVVQNVFYPGWTYEIGDNGRLSNLNLETPSRVDDIQNLNVEEAMIRLRELSSRVK